jgi:hypothetical protein
MPGHADGICSPLLTVNMPLENVSFTAASDNGCSGRDAAVRCGGEAMTAFGGKSRHSTEMPKPAGFDPFRTSRIGAWHKQFVLPLAS